MADPRQIRSLIQGTRVLEGAGVPVLRYLSNHTVQELDPFLMLDELHLGPEFADMEGFPWHPHHGQATFSYLLQGTMVHEDTIGNKGSVSSGGAQYMVAADGIEHSETPGQERAAFWGFQLWINLDHEARQHAPTYQNLPAHTIPERKANGSVVRTVAGPGGAIKDPVRDLRFLDIRLDAGASLTVDLPATHCTWLLGVEGNCSVGAGEVKPEQLAVLGNVDGVQLRNATAEPVHLLLVSGEPVKEPVFWYGPFVARTQQEMTAVVKRYQRTGFR